MTLREATDIIYQLDEDQTCTVKELHEYYGLNRNIVSQLYHGGWLKITYLTGKRKYMVII